EGIDAAMKELNDAWQAASEDIYKAQQDAGQQTGAEGGGEQQAPPQDNPQDGEVTDVDFEEVK
ncbi:MAG: hypothetical protein HN921_09640, partial [Bacteroidetes bacterium]|nr:hypothetical protein [Bacteroidota bacterium]